MAEIKAFGRSFNTANITTPHKLIIGGVAALAILGSVGYYVLYPQWTQLQELEAKIEEQQIEIADKEVKVAKLNDLKKELAQIENKLVFLRRKIPQSPNVPSLLLDLEEITENKALYGNSASLNDFRPEGIVSFELPAALQDAASSETAKQLKQLPVNVSLTNVSYPDFIQLLSDLESYERTLSFDSISLIPIQDQDTLYTTVNASFKIRAFLLEGGS
jgi:Tfp pilus assembly protein PilO